MSPRRVSTIPVERLLTVSDCAERAAVTELTIRRWIESGQLRAMRTPGGKYRVDARDLNAVLPVVVPSRVSA